MISFVYVDVGGVAIADFSVGNKWEELQAELGVSDRTLSGFKAIWGEYKSEICLHRDIDTLVPILNEELGLGLPKGYSLLEGFLKRFEPNPAIWPTLKAMKEETPVGLLTNMYPRMLDGIQKAKLLPPIEWDVVIDSSVEGCQKPDIEVFELATKKANVPRDQVLFVDNSRSHVEAAQDFGWQGLWYDSKDLDGASKNLLTFFKQHLAA